MRLYHTTPRRNAPSIAATGFQASWAGKFGGGFVYLSRGFWLARVSDAIDPDSAPWYEDWFRDLVVFGFDIPDAVLEADGPPGYTPKPPDDPDYDPELDGPDDEESDEEQQEWLVPPAVADRFCLGPVHWVGDPPLTPAELTTMLARSEVGEKPNAVASS